MLTAYAKRRIAVVCTIGLCLVLGCEGNSLAPVTAILVVNASGDTIAVHLWEREDSYRVDPAPEYPTASAADRLILPGGARLVPTTTIAGYDSRKDLRIFVYRVQGTRTVFHRILDATARTMRRRGFVVEIPEVQYQRP